MSSTDRYVAAVLATLAPFTDPEPLPTPLCLARVAEREAARAVAGVNGRPLDLADVTVAILAAFAVVGVIEDPANGPCDRDASYKASVAAQLRRQP